MDLLERDKDNLKALKALSETILPEIKAFRIVAALTDSKGNFISFGFPRRKTHPLMKQVSLNDNKAYLHAEVDCILRGNRKVKDPEERKGLTLMVHRSKMIKTGYGEEYEWTNGMSQPCESCQRLIGAMGFRRIIYSTERGYQVL